MTAPDLLVSRCQGCTFRYLPRAGPCPHCGAERPAPYAIPPEGVVLAATELLSPAQGWSAPHRLALIELAEAVRVLAVVRGTLPEVGARVTVTRDADVYSVDVPAG